MNVNYYYYYYYYVLYLHNIILNSKINTACLQAYNLPWTMRQISIGYPLITGDLPAYDLP